MEKEKKRGVRHRTIYKFIWKSKFSNRKEHRAFKRAYKLLKLGKRCRKRGNYKDYRGLIPGRIPIQKRSALADRRKRPGDIEVDLIIVKNY